MSYSTAAAVRLTPVDRGDLPLLRSWINTPTIAEPFLFVGPVSEAEHVRWFERQMSDASVETYIGRLEDGSACGVFLYKNLSAAQRTGELAIYLGPDRQGQGLGNGLLEAGLRAGFDEFRLRKIHLHVRADNATAIKLYERAGFQREGLLQGDVVYRGATVDILRMALTDAAWRNARGRGLRVALMQPAFLPWLGFFELMASVDRFVLLDDFQVSRQTHSQRNRLFLSPGRPGFVTLPIAHEDNLSATFRDIRVVPDTRWWRKLQAALQQSYGRAPFYAEIMALFEPVLSQPKGSLCDVNDALIRGMARHLGLATDIRFSSETPTRGLRRSERVLKLLELQGARSYYSARGSFGYMLEDGVFPDAGIEVLFQDFQPVPYRQTGATDFEPRLSAADALFNLSPDQCRRVLFGTRKWQRWDEIADMGRPDSGSDGEAA